MTQQDDRPVPRGLGRRVWALFTPYRSSLVLIVLAVLVSSGLGIVTPFLTRRCSPGWSAGWWRSPWSAR